MKFQHLVVMISPLISNQLFLMVLHIFLSIVDKKDTVVGANTSEIHLKIHSPKMLFRFNQGIGDKGATAFIAQGDLIDFEVIPINSSN